MPGAAPTATAAGPGTAHHPKPDVRAVRPGVCPYFHEAVELLGKRWTGAVVHALLGGPMRFSELTHVVPQISDRLLSMRLKELEACGIVVRRVYEGAPVRVEYELTSKGRALEPAISALRAWARAWLLD